MLRLQRLLDPAKPRHKARTGSPVAFALFLLFSLAAVLPAWQPPAAEPPSPYSLWLNQDVVYIISDAERDAFLRLSSAEEREKFIEQFWQRRDPTPATPHENQAKEEHYRRIGYANARFATKAKSGWRTERGRMYIVYGPPDELESHPSGQGGKPPREAWLYHQIKGLGDNLMLTFVDTEGNGDYRLAPGKAR